MCVSRFWAFKSVSNRSGCPSMRPPTPGGPKSSVAGQPGRPLPRARAALTCADVTVKQHIDSMALEDHIDVVVVAQHEVNVILTADPLKELGGRPGGTPLHG